MARHGKIFGKLAAAWVIFAVCMLGTHARADVGGDVAISTWIIIGEVVVAGHGIINAGGNIYYAISRERPPDSWIGGGWVSGFLNIGLGISVLCLIGDSDNDDTLLAIGLGNMVIGVLDIGSSIWANRMPKKPESKVSVSPLIMRDIEGNPAVGIGLNLVNW